MLQINLYVDRVISFRNKRVKYPRLFSFLKQYEGDIFYKVFNYSIKHHCYRILSAGLSVNFLRDLAKFLVTHDKCDFVSIDNCFVCGFEKYSDTLLSGIDLDNCFSIMVYDDWME